MNTLKAEAVVNVLADIDNRAAKKDYLKILKSKITIQTHSATTIVIAVLTFVDLFG